MMFLKNALSLLLMIPLFVQSQIVINELDSDTPGIDTKEFVELKTQTPFFSLNGYVLVFFNGSSSGGNTSYFSVSLNGLTSDANGLVVIGGNAVSPVPDRVISDNSIQNGEDGVAVYLGTQSDFPTGTLATTTNLIDALVYGNNNPIATTMLQLFGICCQINESVNGLGTTQSIQRKNDGSYEVKTPTPGATNDGTGTQYNGITINAPLNHLNEGENLNIEFTTQQAVTSDLTFSFTLNNDTFDANDYSGNTTVTIPQGSSSVSTNISILLDQATEGDEELKITFVMPIPVGYIRMNDNIIIRVIDQDYIISPWGTPVNPTYQQVTPLIPEGYYASLNGKSGDELRQAIQDIIANPDVVRAHTYGDVTTVLYTADQNPNNSSEIWMMYVEQGRSKLDYQQTSSSVGKWNREHIFPQSRGGFANGTVSFATGINSWLPSSASDIAAGHSDMHHLRAEDGPENSARGNRDYGLDDYNGPSGNLGSWKGDVARALFYMAIRYNLLEVVNGNLPNSTLYQIGDLATLLQWNVVDPSDDFEMNRNNIIYNWQMNRNPFIDYPALADYIWGNNAGQVWNPSMSVETPVYPMVVMYPNPARDIIVFDMISEETKIEIFDLRGALVDSFKTSHKKTYTINFQQGVYWVKIIQPNKITTKKLIVR
jgi:endonuclease I